jgi:hypothetical protein
MTLQQKLTLGAAVALVLLGTTQCGPSKKTAPQRQLILMRGCTDGEALSDLEYSASSLDSFFSANQISVGSSVTTTRCGYILLDGTAADTISEVLTNVGLFEKCQAFFHIVDATEKATR